MFWLALNLKDLYLFHFWLQQADDKHLGYNWYVHKKLGFFMPDKSKLFKIGDLKTAQKIEISIVYILFF